MGGDGGVIASNRRYMRGAGTADCTADYGGSGTNGSNKNADANTNAKDEAARRFRTCALTGHPLRFDEPHAIVCDPYGALYHKEAAVEALLARRVKRKKQQQESTNDGDDVDELGGHIRGLKDLYEVRFNISKEKDNSSDNGTKSSISSVVITCPITNIELNGQVTAYALIPGAPGGQPNVVSERAIKELGEDVVFADQGGDGVKKIRLVPPPDALEEIEESLHKQREAEAAESSAEKKTSSSSKKKKDKRKSKKDKKRKHSSSTAAGAESAAEGAAAETASSKRVAVEGNRAGGSIADMARSKVSTAVKQNQVLSSLFQQSNTGTTTSEKEKKDNLFAR